MNRHPPLPTAMRPTPPPTSRQPGARPPAWRTASLLSLMALGVASPLAVLSLLGASAAVGQTTKLGVSPGVHHDGVAVLAAAAVGPASSTAAAHGLALRRGCQWGQPGRQPYQGSVRQALQAAGLPEDVIAQIEDQHRNGRKSGRLAISRSGIRHTGDGRVFPARGIALTYGMTLCQDATVNFARGHVEMADLYEARDAQGNPHAVMVPDVCGNVSVLGAAGARGGRGTVAGVAATLNRRAQALAELAEVLDPQTARLVAAVDQANSSAAASAAQASADAAADSGGTGADGRVDDPAGDPGDAGAIDAGAGGGVAAGGRLNADAIAMAGAGRQAGRPVPLGSAQPVIPGGWGAAGGGTSSAPLVALATVSNLLVPPVAAASLARGVGRVTAATGRSLETLARNTGGGGGGGGGGAANASGQAQQVPEPGSLALSLLGLALLAWRLRRRG